MPVETPFDRVRNELVAEAIASPSLLSDLAGLEAYVGETYAARALIELVQNAEDAGATRLVARLSSGGLTVANDGSPFSEDDFRALCRSAASKKLRGESIGFRGIGFKSAVTLGNQVLLLSGSFEVLFSRELTRALLPNLERVPLIRIPHPVPLENRGAIEKDVKSLRTNNFVTVFHFEDPDTRVILGEFGDFSASAMLFLRKIISIDLISDDGRRGFSCARSTKVCGREEVTLSANSAAVRWELVFGANVTLAFRVDLVPISEIKHEYVVHSFLPTDEPTGFGIKINGDFDTDPSRTRIVFTDRTSSLVDETAKLLAELLQESLQGALGPRSSAMHAAISPMGDPRITALGKRSFARDLLAGLKAHTKEFAKQFRVKPLFLNQRSVSMTLRHLGV